jgi:tetratricopeptide (TPR) repeat protein
MKYLSLAILFLIFACTSEDNTAFSALESEVAENPTNANVSDLLNEYTAWLANNPEANAARKDVLLKIYDLSEKHIRQKMKLSALKGLVLDYPKDPENLDRLIEMSSMLEQMRKTGAAQILNQAITQMYPGNPKVKEKILPLLPVNLLPIDTVIYQLGRAMFDIGSMRLNNRVGRQYVDACEAYAIVFDGTPQAADLLHKAAETARTLNTIYKAIELYDWILTRYPDDPRSAQALFLKAFTYDSNLGDIENAGKYYKEFLDKYPDDDFAESATFLMQNLGKDDDELLDILQKKSQEEN